MVGRLFPLQVKKMSVAIILIIFGEELTDLTSLPNILSYCHLPAAKHFRLTPL